jgi:hypothetical protein
LPFWHDLFSAARTRIAAERAADLAPIIAGIQGAGVVPLRAMATDLNWRNIPAPQGGTWSAVQIQRILA